MKNRRLSKCYRIFIFIVPLALIALLVYANVTQLAADSSRATHLLINEVVADNLSTLKDENGVYADWIELYNPTGKAIDMKGYYLSDSRNELSKWAFPDVRIDSEGYLIVFCDRNTQAGALHTNFLLNADKETIWLSDENENVIDSIKLENQQCDISYGRMYGNVYETGFLPYSTPLGANPSYFTQNNRPEEDWGEVSFSLEGGCYEEPIQVALSCDVEGAAILYTLDGSEPDINAFVYDKPLTITNESRSNRYTTKKCSIVPGDNVDNADTQYGVNEVYKATVVRARILKDAKLATSIQTNTYFIDSNYTLPMVSLTTDPDALFDDRDGAYVLGYTYYTMRKYGMEANRINSNMQSDLTGHLEIYDTDGSVFEDDIMFSIAGMASVPRAEQKNFNVILENKKITGRMFGASDALKYERFSLRGTGKGIVKDFVYSYASAFVSNYISDEGVGGQNSRFCILFIDGEYWGIYTLMEPKGKEYMSQYAKAPKKDITMVATWKGISDKEFDGFFEEITCHSFDTNDDYEWVKTKVDMDNYMASVFIEGFFGNTDGISKGDHNLYMWKEKDGLWKWQIFDFDCTMVDNENYFKDMLEIELGVSTEDDKKNFTSWLFQKLWRCDAFREDFISYARMQCNGLYAKEKVTSAFEEHLDAFAVEMPENLRRCEKGYTKLKQISFAVRGIDAEYDNYTMEDWDITINDVRKFLANRTARVLEFLDEIEQEDLYE